MIHINIRKKNKKNNSYYILKIEKIEKIKQENPKNWGNHPHELDVELSWEKLSNY
jgi:hypothetical protein